MPSVERAALMSRVKQCTLNEQISSELIKGTIRPPPVSIMGTERAGHKLMPDEEVLKREIRDNKAVGVSENKTMAMSNPAQPFRKLPTYGYTGHAVISRNRYMITVPGPYESTPDPGHSTAFVLNTTFLEPFIYGLVVVGVDILIDKIESIQYDRGILNVNEFLIGAVSHRKELRLCLLHATNSLSKKDHKIEMPMLFKEEKEPEIKEEEPTQDESRKEKSIQVDADHKVQAGYGF
ncbi:unnamed protein product [Hymenolepis diminuta]|uniref:Uncharacterized protein n=1 Tax=Hymenolepis diminuta TaxID=6216 RepID=A0A564YK64_HYMDI|nr:unnamed protein product [Hymenolepis diminuta]